MAAISLQPKIALPNLDRTEEGLCIDSSQPNCTTSKQHWPVDDYALVSHSRAPSRPGGLVPDDILVGLSGGRNVKKERHELFWEGLFSDPTRCLEFRQAKKSHLHPDLSHWTSEVALWLDNRYRPAWVDGQLGISNRLAGGVRGRLGSASASTSGNNAGFRRVRTYHGDMEGVTSSKVNEEGQVSEAVQQLELVVQQGSFVDDALLYRVLKRCIADKDLVLGRRIHSLSVKSGHESNAFLANHIIRMYASHGRLGEAMQVFTKVAVPNIYTWASIILAFAEHGQSKQAIQLYRRMQGSTLKPNNHVFVAVLKACGSGGDLTTGKKIHADILGSPDEPNIFVGNSLVDMYAKCGSLEDARKVFDILPARDIVTWTTIIAAYAQHGLGQEALTLYAGMQEDGIIANRVTYASLLQACASIGALHQGKVIHSRIQDSGLEADVVIGNCLVNMYAKCGSLDDARKVFERLPTRNVVTWTAMIAATSLHGQGQEALLLYESMQQEGLSPVDPFTFASVLKACASARALHLGRELHSQVQKKGLEANAIVGSCLVDMYAKCGSLEDAKKVFDRLPTRDIVTWTAMISVYAQEGFGQEALAIYTSMEKEGIVPNRVTLVCLLQACASVGALHMGKKLHVQIMERGLEGDLFVGSCLVDMYAKCGNLVEARRVFDRLPAKDVVTWNSLLNGCAKHSDGQMAVHMFEEMLQQGINPNNVTFLCLLMACSHEGLVDEGQQYFKSMGEDHGIAPTIHHYNCMVDLLARSGRLDEAEHLLRTMPFQSDVIGWTTLLGACKSYGDVERGARSFESFIALEPGNAIAYVLLASIYANAGMMMDVDRVERLRKCAGAKKKPAKACIEVNNKVHKFTVGEEKGDVSSKSRSMNVRLKEEGGHVPQTQLVLKPVSDLEKEDALCGHAEKLALAYGLLNTPEGTTLLVTKNLRMCGDCHSSTKVMSQLEKREIIVRDAHRVHHFLDGSCSCGDRH